MQREPEGELRRESSPCLPASLGWIRVLLEGRQDCCNTDLSLLDVLLSVNSLPQQHVVSDPPLN